MKKTITITNENKNALNIIKQLDDMRKKQQDRVDAIADNISELLNNKEITINDFDENLLKSIHKNNDIY